METMLPIMYDLAAVVIVLLTVSYSSQKGFAATIVGVAGHIAAFFGASFLAKLGSQILYTTIIRGKVMEFLETRLFDAGEVGDLFSQLQEIVSELPKLAANIVSSAGLDEAALSSAIGSTVSNAVKVLEQSVIRPAVTGFLSAALFVVLFFVFSILARSLTKAIRFVFRTPLLMPIDRFFGGVIGVAQAGIYLYLICVAFHLLFSFVGSMQYLNQNIILDTFIWSRVYTFDPFSFL